jgi:hypothetical protein
MESCFTQEKLVVDIVLTFFFAETCMFVGPLVDLQCGVLMAVLTFMGLLRPPALLMWL